MILPMSVTAFAETGRAYDESECSQLPIVFVRGMDFPNLKINPDSDDSENAIKFDFKTVAPFVSKAVLNLIKGDKDSALENVIDCSYEIFKYNAMDENGDPLYNTGMVKYPESAENYPLFYDEYDLENGLTHTLIESMPAKHVYYIHYDWRLDPLTVADEINDTVNRAIEATGHEKVKIICSSMGGIMTMGYLTKYGYDKVERCLFMSSTFCGTQIASDMFTGKIKFTPETLYNFCYNAVSDSFILSRIVKSLYKSGLFNSLMKVTDYIVDNYKDEVYERVFVPVFSHMPVFWGLIQPEDYEDAVDYILGGRTDENAEFLKRTDALRDMMKNRNELLDNMISDGVKIAVVSHYNQPLAPVYESADFNGDTVLETRQTSGYATVAKYGETLGDDYVPENEKYLSPDRVIDLSTAILPEYTYIIKNAPHVACSYGTEYNEFAMYLLTTDGDLKPGTNERYPQFMISDKNKETLKSFD